MGRSVEAASGSKNAAFSRRACAASARPSAVCGRPVGQAPLHGLHQRLQAQPRVAHQGHVGAVVGGDGAGVHVQVQDGTVWREGICQCSVVVEPARAPMNITRSACATTARVAGTPPLVPMTPAFSGWVSARLPWPLTVVHTGAFSSVASASSASLAPAMTTPPPQTSTGRASSHQAVGGFVHRGRVGRAAVGRKVRRGPAGPRLRRGRSSCFCTS